MDHFFPLPLLLYSPSHRIGLIFISSASQTEASTNGKQSVFFATIRPISRLGTSLPVPFLPGRHVSFCQCSVDSRLFIVFHSLTKRCFPRFAIYHSPTGLASARLIKEDVFHHFVICTSALCTTSNLSSVHPIFDSIIALVANPTQNQDTLGAQRPLPF